MRWVSYFMQLLQGLLNVPWSGFPQGAVLEG